MKNVDVTNSSRTKHKSPLISYGMKTLERISRVKKSPPPVSTSADLAHSLQTPLAILKSELFFLRQELPHDPRAMLCDRLIDDIACSLRSFLEMSRIEKPTHETPLRRFCLSSLFKETAQHLETLAKAHGVTLHYVITPDIHLAGHSDKMRELLIQIVGNSISYIGHGPKKEIYVVLSKRNGAATLTVTDTGVGISKEDLPHLFEPFYRGKNVTKAGLIGTGLGLASVKKIVDAHRAKIRIESILNKGTQTTVRIPLS